MSARASLELRTCVFGSIETGIWGIVRVPGEERQGRASFGAVAGDAGVSKGIARIEGSEADQDWKLRADGVELTLSPAGEAARIGSAQQGGEDIVQLCRVQGRLALDHTERDLDCFGQRGTRAGGLALARLESLREVTAWFGPGEGFALLSLRPRRASGHDQDVVNARLFEAGGPLEVADPRLSTTYAASGAPSRASLELWLDELEDPIGDATEADEPPVQSHFPRRAAGEAVGATAKLAVAGLEVRAELFRWHMRGSTGTGVYLLAHPS